MNDRFTSQGFLRLLNSDRRLPFLGVLALVCFLALSSQSANAQVAFGSMVGSVTDASGSAIPGASVKITLVQTNDSRSVATNELGGYTIATVTPCRSERASGLRSRPRRPRCWAGGA